MGPEHCGRIEGLSHLPRDFRSADVIGDMRAEKVWREAQPLQFGGDVVGGVIADEQEAGFAAGIEQFECCGWRVGHGRVPNADGARRIM